MIVVAALVGIICGFFTAHSFLATSWTSLIFWGIIGVGVGFFCANRKEIVSTGVAFGFFVTISFLLFGFQGASDKFAGFVVFSLGLSILGAFCGIVLTYIGSSARSRRKRS